MMAGVNFSTKTRQVSQWKVTDVAGVEIEASYEKKAPKEPQDKAQQMIRNILAQGLEAAQVAQLTGLPLEEVEALME
jgi:hypothetical protein